MPIFRAQPHRPRYAGFPTRIQNSRNLFELVSFSGEVFWGVFRYIPVADLIGANPGDCFMLVAQADLLRFKGNSMAQIDFISVMPVNNCAVPNADRITASLAIR